MKCFQNYEATNHTYLTNINFMSPLLQDLISRVLLELYLVASILNVNQTIDWYLLHAHLMEDQKKSAHYLWW